MNEKRIKVNFNNESFTEGQKKEINLKVDRWIRGGYSCMAIMHFLAQYNYGVSGTEEGEEFVITIH